MEIGDLAYSVGSGLLKGVVWLILLGFLSVVGYFGSKLFMKEMRYKYLVRIFEKDSLGNITERKDRAGIFPDRKTQQKLFFLKKAKVGLDPNKLKYILNNKFRTVYILQLSLKNFRFLTPSINPETGSLKLLVGDADLSWAINSYERNKKMFASTTLMQMMPFLALAFVSIIILILFIYFFKEFGTLSEIAVAMKEAAQELAKAKAGTVVIPAG